MAGRGQQTYLLRRGLRLEYATLAWNVVGIAVLAYSAVAARSIALGGFRLDSLIEIGASAVVIWELKGADDSRRSKQDVPSAAAVRFWRDAL